MWTRKCLQCVALLHWECKKGENDLSDKQQIKTKRFHPRQLMLNLVWKTKKIVKKKLLFFRGTWRFKKPKDLVGWGSYFEPDDAFSWVQGEKEKEVVFKVEGTFESHFKTEKKTYWGQKNTLSVTLIPRLYYLPALTSLSEMAHFLQGMLE